MSGMVVPVVTSYNISCDFCHKGFKRLYPLDIDGQKFMFCGQEHYVKARGNWEEKKKLGLTNPDLPQDLTQPQDDYTDLELPE